MKDNKLKSITIRVDSGVYETIEEMKKTVYIMGTYLFKLYD